MIFKKLKNRRENKTSISTSTSTSYSIFTPKLSKRVTDNL